MDMRKVYVVQKPLRFDATIGDLVPTFDIEPALKFGKLVYLLSSSAGPFNMDRVIPELQKKLVNFTQDDYLLLVGNPCLIGVTCTIAAGYSGGDMNLLQWNGKLKEYKVVVVNKVFS